MKILVAKKIGRKTGLATLCDRIIIACGAALGLSIRFSTRNRL
jgi:hypothetical protein